MHWSGRARVAFLILGYAMMLLLLPHLGVPFGYEQKMNPERELKIALGSTTGERKNAPKVFLIDKDKFAISLFSSLFQRAGATVNGLDVSRAKPSAQDIVKKVIELAPDVIMLEMVLGYQYGLEVLKLLKGEARTQKIPVFILTNDLVYRDEALDEGAADFIIKASIKPPDFGHKILGYLDDPASYAPADSRNAVFPKSSSQDLNLQVTVGKDDGGKDLVLDFATGIKHLLIAGCTGSGKSTLLHKIIGELLEHNLAENLRLILIDPKRVELVVHDGIPHLLTPVITDTKKALTAFKWTVKEIDRREGILKQSNSSSISAYKGTEHMPHLMVIVDELSDIMYEYPKEVEDAIFDVIKRGPPVGVQLILSSSRPHEAVFSKKIRDGISTRIALQTASVTDSEFIIGTAGAFSLDGKGDMLFRDGLRPTIHGHIEEKSKSTNDDMVKMTERVEFDPDPEMPSLRIEDDFGVTTISIYPHEKTFEWQFSVKDDASYNTSTIEYRVHTNPISVESRLLEQKHEPPEEYEVKDGVVLESEIRQKSNIFSDVEEKVSQLKRQVDWQVMTTTQANNLMFYLLSRHPEIVPSDEFRKFIRQTSERIKTSLLKIQAELKKVDSTGLQIVDTEYGTRIWYPDMNRLSEEILEERGRHANEIYKSFFPSDDSVYAGITSSEFFVSNSLLKTLDELLNLKEKPVVQSSHNKLSVGARIGAFVLVWLWDFILVSFLIWLLSLVVPVIQYDFVFAFITSGILAMFVRGWQNRRRAQEK